MVDVRLQTAKSEDYGVAWANLGFNGQSSGERVGKQVWALLITLSLAIVSGLLVGVIMARALPPLRTKELYEDDPMWEVADDYWGVGAGKSGPEVEVELPVRV